MSFPISRQCQFYIEAAEAADFRRKDMIEAMAHWAADAGARRLQTGPEGLLFKGGLFSFITDWRISTSRRMTVGFNPLIPVSNATVEVRREAKGYLVSCRYRFTELLVFSVILILLFLGLPRPDAAPIAGLPANAWLAVGWCGVFLWGFWVSPARITRELEAAAREGLDAV